MAFSLGEYQDIFLEEADEQLQELNQNLLELEKNPENLEIINNIFRAAHSLKSSAAFVGLNELSDLAHMMENLLQGIRDGSMGITPEIIDIIFKCFDEIHNVIDTIASGEKPEQDLQWLIDDIKAICEKSTKPKKEDRKAAREIVTDGPHQYEVPKTLLDADARKKIKHGLDHGKSCCEVTVFIDDKAQMKWVKAQLVVNNLGKIGEIVATFPSMEDMGDDGMNNVVKIVLLTDQPGEDVRRAANIDLIHRIDIRTIRLSKKDGKLMLQFSDSETFYGDQLLAEGGGSAAAGAVRGETETAGIKEEIEDAAEDEEEEEEGAEADHAVKGADKDAKKKVAMLKTVKVSIDKLDLLLNNVGELVIANSGFFKLYEEMRKISEEKSIINEFKSRMEQMSRIAKDLQSGIMKTRMVPIGQVFTRFRRLVRDLAKEFNKDVELIIKGEDTELDKKVIDSIGEPLLHLLRNAVDHGIETAAERKKLGKSETAHITMNAYQSGNQIFVDVSDDGRGLNLEQIKRKAVAMGLATPEMISSMDDQDIYNYIFTPGFSTAEKITDISGRGVGMNVVKEIVSELNGSVSIETELGMGTRFVLSFPITLAIIPAIMVKVRNEMYAIPLTDVIETIKISQSDITTIEGHEVINLRGEILSLLRLSRFINLESALGPDDKMPVVVVGFGSRKIGLIVDYLEGKLEIVIKSLEQNYKTVEGLAGASILGDGSICLILDISSMINKVILEQDRVSKYDRRKIAEADVEEVEDEDMPVKEPAGRAAVRETAPAAGAKAGAGATVSSEARTAEAKKQAPAESKTSEPASRIAPEKKPDNIVRVFADQEAPRPQAKAPEPDAKIEQRVHKALDEFREELRESIKTTAGTGFPSDHMADSISLTRDELREFQLVANIGAANAAESLSKILNKQIDLSIPEVTVMPIEQIPKHIGDIDSIYMGIMMPILGDTRGTVLFIFKENSGFEVIDLLYGLASKTTHEFNEDGQSALQELTNIVGSSVINVIAEKSNLVIRAGLPTIVHDYLQSVIDSILVLHNMLSDYAVIMDTAFFFENDKIIGNLLLLPEADSLKIIVERMRTNVGSN
ncbi:MAG TPA: chemotaxis protein CheW [Spirochaetota bacterium]|nr:chemotaxis protein CheW [Spirochaetota bacterium]HPC40968.1 chemotaxis protein CheW [Spirochaetota bacterium]HPL18517.1 chemotaxis protein CheW [Spirochaetota bacterium]HQJ70828.1 chemotaxis protein CheW [Spirochaetota bacterium]HRS77206.1 chemotaxis protein CheW [Spirochaetota bacterium]